MKRKSTSRPIAAFPGKLTGGPGVKVLTEGLAVTVQVDYGAVSFFETTPTGEWDILLQRRGTFELSRVKLELTNVEGAAAATAAVTASQTATTRSTEAAASAAAALASEAAAANFSVSAGVSANSASASEAVVRDIQASLEGVTLPPSNTDGLPEGTTNLYYTQTRARGALSVTGSLAYDPATGVISYTAPVLSTVGRTGLSSDLIGELPVARLPALTGGDVTSTAGSGTLTLGANRVTLAQMAQLSAARFLGRTSAATGNVEALTPAQATSLLDVFGGDVGAGGVKGLVPAVAAGDAAANKFLKANGAWTAIPTLAAIATSGSATDLIAGTVPAARMPAHTGDVTTAAGAVATTIANDVVTNAKLADMAASTIKGRRTTTGDPEDLTGAQATALLSAMVGDSGSGGVKGLVPAPATGDATKFLTGAGTWSSPAGAGDVTGPLSSVDSELVLFNGTTGKSIKAGGLPNAQYARMDGTNAGPLGDRNFFINAEFTVNQRNFTGNTVAAGAYCYDRWKGGTGGATLVISGNSVTLTGRLTQVIELPRGLAGEVITVSVLAPSGTLDVTVAAAGTGSGTVTGTIMTSTGRGGATLTVPTTATGNLSVTFYAVAAVSFSQPLFEMGASVTKFRPRPLGITIDLCERYYQTVVMSYRFWAGNTATSYLSNQLRVRMTAAPTITTLAAGTLTNVTTATFITEGSDSTGTVRFTVTPSAANVNAAVLGAQYALDAEL